jgi:hypothetical protein
MAQVALSRAKKEENISERKKIITDAQELIRHTLLSLQEQKEKTQGNHTNGSQATACLAQATPQATPLATPPAPEGTHSLYTHGTHFFF